MPFPVSGFCAAGGCGERLRQEGERATSEEDVAGRVPRRRAEAVDAGARPNTDAEPEPDPDPKPEPDADPKPEPEPDTESEPEPGAGW